MLLQPIKYLNQTKQSRSEAHGRATTNYLGRRAVSSEMVYCPDQADLPPQPKRYFTRFRTAEIAFRDTSESLIKFEAIFASFPKFNPFSNILSRDNKILRKNLCATPKAFKGRAGNDAIGIHGWTIFL